MMTGRRWLAVASIAGACVLLLSVSCGGGEKTVTGFVLEVVERNLVEIELLRVRDRSGRIWEFTTEGNIGMSAAHLKQHQVLGQGVVVLYDEVGGQAVAVEVLDFETP